MRFLIYISIILSFLLSTTLIAGKKSDSAKKSYETYCLSCHGKNLEGGLGPSLINKKWLEGSSDKAFNDIVQNGRINNGMPAFGETLDEEKTRALLIYIKEQNSREKDKAVANSYIAKDGIYKTQHHQFTFELLHTLDKGLLWAVNFLPDGTILLTSRDGNIFLFKNGTMSKPIKGPKVRAQGQGGLLEGVPHPNYEKNGWIYLTYAESLDNNKSAMTAIARGRIKNNKWVDQEIIFTTGKEFHRTSKVHYGSRIVFEGDYLYFSIGDRGDSKAAQDLSKPNGKIHRIHHDGSIPKDNPFIKQGNAFPSIWCYGNRNPQGLDKHPVTGTLWEVEHGPRGGDELNIIEKGNNYGWPTITYGMNYNGKPITAETHKEGMEQPIHYWVPSIAMCGIDFYEGDTFNKWENDLFIAAMKGQQLERIKLDGNKILEHEIMLKGKGRIRDVANGPDGNLYFVMDGLKGNKNGSVLCRILPSK